MTPEQAIEDLLNRWEDLREAGHEPSVDELCQDCPELRDQLQSQIAELRRIDHFLSHGLSPEPESDLTPAGRYKPMHLHAQGGLGEVFVAQDEELHRQVALKRIQPAQSQSADRRQRFQLEAEITGNLEHPGIVPVYGLGQDSRGCLYYAMRFIQGETLEQAVKTFHSKHPPGTELATQSIAFQKLLRSFLAVCETVAYAHNQGIIHRDLKPANIMLGKYGESLVVDWGLAKRISIITDAKNNSMPPLAPTDANSTADFAATLFGQIKGSPAYMSPEQAEGETTQISVQSDVYSLGATLYAILTGQSPFTSKSLPELLDKVRKGDFPHPQLIRGDIPQPLAAICLKAMSRNQHDRYATPLMLATDIEHWLAGEPVSAWNEPWTVIVKRWIRKHQTLVSTTVVGGCVAFVGLGALAWKQSQSNKALGSKNQQLILAQEQESKARLYAENQERIARSAEAKIREANQQLRAELYAFQVLTTERALNEGNRAFAVSSLEKCPADLRNVEWHMLHRRCMASRMTIKTPGGIISAVASSSDGSRFASTSDNGPVRVYQAEGKLIAELAGPASKLLWLPDGDSLVVLRSSGVNAAGLLEVWSISECKQIAHIGPAYAFGVSRDGNKLVVANTFWPNPTEQQKQPESELTMFETLTGKRIMSLPKLDGHITATSFSPDGKQIYAVTRLFDLEDPLSSLAFMKAMEIGDHFRLMGWDAETKQTLFDVAGPGKANALGMALSDDGASLVVVDSRAGTIRTRPVMLYQTLGRLLSYDPKNGELRHTAHCEQLNNITAGQGKNQVLRTTGNVEARFVALALNPQGNHMALALGDRAVVYELKTGKVIEELAGHLHKLTGLTFCGQNSLLSAGGNDGAVKLWQLGSTKAVHLAIPTRSLGSWSNPAFSHDSTRLAVSAMDGTIGIHDAASGQKVLTLPTVLKAIDQAQLHAMESRYPLPHPAGEPIDDLYATDLQFSANDKRLTVIYEERLVIVWDISTNTPKIIDHFDECELEPVDQNPVGPFRLHTKIRLSPDARYFSVTSQGPGQRDHCVCRVREVASRQQMLVHENDAETTLDAAFYFSPDSNRFIIDRRSAQNKPRMLMWNVAQGKPIEPDTNMSLASPAQSTADGTRLAQVVRGVVQIDDLSKGTSFLSIGGEREYQSVTISRNGYYIAAVRNKMVDIYDASPIKTMGEAAK